MLETPLPGTRIAIGTTAGFVLGLVGFLMLPYVLPSADPMLSWGYLLWYTSLGAIIAALGVLDWQEVLERPIPWWIGAPAIGAWMNFVLTLLIYHHLRAFSQALFGEASLLVSPFWFAGEGVVVGLIIGYACTHFGGEGTGR